MEYRFLGPTGLKVSALSFGNMTQLDVKLQKDYDAIAQRCFESGINYFDTAESYNQGTSEIILGESIKTLKASREELVISTKVFFGTGPFRVLGKPNTSGLSRKHVVEGVLGSLKRLQLDYADIVFCHRYDGEVPLEETCRAMNWLIENGKAFYWGTSEWSAQQIQGKFICLKIFIR
jgi:aryl-alcohol dehydrogenase-like predicted oxidoreductase